MRSQGWISATPFSSAWNEPDETDLRFWNLAYTSNRKVRKSHNSGNRKLLSADFIQSYPVGHRPFHMKNIQVYLATVIFVCFLTWMAFAFFVFNPGQSEKPFLYIGMAVCLPGIYFTFCFLSCFKILRINHLKFFGIIVHLLLLPLVGIVFVLLFTPLLILIPCSLAWLVAIRHRLVTETSNPFLKSRNTCGHD